VKKLLVVALLGAAACARTPPPSTPPPAASSAPASPPFRQSVGAAEQLPKTLPPERFASQPVAARAYRIAAQIPAVLAQQPCYCGCDAIGHGSLLDCFTTDHGAG